MLQWYGASAADDLWVGYVSATHSARKPLVLANESLAPWRQRVPFAPRTARPLALARASVLRWASPSPVKGTSHTGHFDN